MKVNEVLSNPSVDSTGGSEERKLLVTSDMTRRDIIQTTTPRLWEFIIVPEVWLFEAN